MDEAPKDSRKKNLLAALLSALFTVALGLGLIVFLKARRAAAPELSAPEAPALSAAAPASSPEPVSGAKRKLAFKEFVTKFQKQAPDLSNLVASGIQADPDLTAGWQAESAGLSPYQIDRPAVDFLASLHDRPKYPELLHQLELSPQTGSALQNVFERNADLAAVYDELPRAVDRARAQAAAKPLAAQGALATSGGAGWHEGAKAARGAAPAEGAAAVAFQRIAAPGLLAETGGPARKTRRPGAPARRPDAGEAAAVALAALNAVGPDNPAAAYFKSLFAQLPEEQRERLTDACDKHDVCDPVEACEYAKLVRECQALCASDAKCASSPVLRDLKQALRPRKKHRTGLNRLKHKAGL